MTVKVEELQKVWLTYGSDHVSSENVVFSVQTFRELAFLIRKNVKVFDGKHTY